MREVRLFKTQKEMFADFGAYSTAEDEQVRLRGKYLTTEVDGRTSVSWYCEEDHDIPQCIMGYEIYRLLLTCGLSPEVVSYALTRVRCPAQ